MPEYICLQLFTGMSFAFYVRYDYLCHTDTVRSMLKPQATSIALILYADLITDYQLH